MSRSDRFWAKVTKGPGCWLYSGPFHRQGYGWFGRVLAHRVAWELTFGPIPPGQAVLHDCDNPPCVRPDHLMLGDQKENVRQSFERGRSPRQGEANGRAKLTWEEVREMRRLREEEGLLYRELGERFGIAKQYAWNICNGRFWKEGA